MATSNGTARSLAATVVGYIVVAIVAIWLLGAVIGVVVWLVRTILIVAAVLGLIVLYLKLKTPKDV